MATSSASASACSGGGDPGHRSLWSRVAAAELRLDRRHGKFTTLADSPSSDTRTSRGSSNVILKMADGRCGRWPMLSPEA
eukprot:5069023-Prymnesium_polylepis.3